jgi:hypothetical protein
VNDLSTHAAAMEVELECLRKMLEDLYTCDLTITSLEGTWECRTIALTFKEKELANMEKWLVDAGLQECAPHSRVCRRSSRRHGRSRHRRSGTSWARLKWRWCPMFQPYLLWGTGTGSEQCAPHARVCRSQDAKGGGGRRRSAGGRGSHPGGEGGGARADVFSEPGPHHLLGSDGTQTHRRDRGSGHGQRPGGCQDHGCTVLVPTERRIGLPF